MIMMDAITIAKITVHKNERLNTKFMINGTMTKKVVKLVVFLLFAATYWTLPQYGHVILPPIEKVARFITSN